jgi:hypothetical protein
MAGSDAKIEWQGEVLAVQPRIRLMRSFDERAHVYLGYTLRIRGAAAGVEREFVIGIGKAAHKKHAFRVGDRCSGKGVRVPDANLETADLYKISALRLLARGREHGGESAPFLGVPPPLEVYRERGHRRLAARTFATRCATCIWGCEMPVEIVIDKWNPERVRHRRETFCYGPKSCRLYAAGPTRKVPGRKGMTWEEADWIDADTTAHRDPDE